MPKHLTILDINPSGATSGSTLIHDGTKFVPGVSTGSTGGGGGGTEIDDSVVGTGTTYSSSKIVGVSAIRYVSGITEMNNIPAENRSVGMQVVVQTTTGTSRYEYKSDNTFKSSISFGENTQPIGVASVAEGQYTIASGYASHAEGYYSEANGNYSHAQGLDCIANGEGSHAGGNNTIASGNYSFAHGFTTSGIGESSFAIGQQTKAVGNYSSAQGLSTTAEGIFSHVEGHLSRVTVSGDAGHAEGYSTIVSNKYGHAEGYATTGSGQASHSEGSVCMASGHSSHAEGYATRAFGMHSHSEGSGSMASGQSSHAEGTATTASGFASHAEGEGSEATGTTSHAEGTYCFAYGGYSHAQGFWTKTTGLGAHSGGLGAEGMTWLQAQGRASFNHSEIDYDYTGQGARANNSAILGGLNHYIFPGAVGSAIIGGTGITATSPNTVHVPNLLSLGDVTATGYTTSSDERLKTDITPLAEGSGLETIKQITPYTYHKNGNTKIEHGFIAQQVEAILPDMVGEYSINEDETYKTLDYQQMIPILMQAIKDQQKLIDSLREEVEMLKSK